MPSYSQSWAPLAIALFISLVAQAAEVKTYTKDVQIEVGKETITQTRWYLENDLVRVGVIEDPGGAVVEYLNKANDVNHVAGQVYKIEKDGQVERFGGWGWCEFFADEEGAPKEEWMYSQPFTAAFVEGEAGARGIEVTGHTPEQRIVRRMMLRPDSAELTVSIQLSNVSDHPRPLWLRWHPQVFASNDVFGDHGCVLSPGTGDNVRKIRIGWGWDHWLWTHDGYWLAADFKTGDGLFCAFEKEKTPIHFTWTQYKHGRPTSGAVTLEPFPRLITAEPGASIDATFTYCPFSRDTDPAAIPLMLLKDTDEQQRARRFLARVMPLAHLEKLGAYTYAKSIQFPWGHRRRDLPAVRDWGFADCAIMGYPSQDKPLRVRLTGAAFDEAKDLKGWPKWKPGVTYHITMTDEGGNCVYDQRELAELVAGVPGIGGNTYDREIAIPVTGIPDGSYELAVEALDPITKKPFHAYRRKLEVFGDRLAVAEQQLSEELTKGETDSPFVRALAGERGELLADGSARIPIGLESVGVDRLQFPITLGIPLPEKAFSRDASATLLDSRGREVPAQFETMNVWPDGSLKWLRVDFQADCPADSHVFYSVRVGPASARPEPPKLIVDRGDSLEITTGPLRAIISKTALSVPGLVSIDRNADGAFTEDECLTRATGDSDIWWTDAAGTRYAMSLQGPSSLYFQPGVTIEENGSLAATIKIQGWYSSPERPGHRPAYGEIRLRFFKDKAWFQAWHQVTFTGSPWDDELKSYGLSLNLQPTHFGAVDFDLDGATVSGGGAAALYQGSANRASLSSGAVGRKSTGAVAVSGAGGNFLLYHRNFWQMYPKKLDADATQGRVTISYWPEEAGIHTFKPVEEQMIPSSSSPEACGTGASRTDELVFDFSSQVAPTQAAATYGEPVAALAPPTWTQTTGVVGNLQPYDSAISPEVEDYIKLYIDFHLRNREFFGFYGHWDYGTLHNVYNLEDYTWRIVGRYANIGNEEDIVQAPWLLYMRCGDRRYLNLAESWTRHLMEVQSIRWHNLFPKSAGLSRRHHYTPWVGHGDTGHSMLCPYLEYYHVTGYRPAWEMAKMAAAAMAETRSGTWRYLSNPIIGNARMYLETGDPSYKQTADRIWNDLCAPDRNDWWGGTHGSRMVRWYAPLNPACDEAWKSWSKGAVTSENSSYNQPFREIDAAAEMGERTDDPWYAHLARWRFDQATTLYSGLIHGTNPIYRGMVPYTMGTQYFMGVLREVATGKGEIARSHQLFPAQLVDIKDAREVLLVEPKDTAFTIWISGQPEQTWHLLGPDGAEVPMAATELFAVMDERPKIAFYALTVPADGATGTYRMKPGSLYYFGCSLPDVTIVTGNTLTGSGVPLYVRADDLGTPEAHFYLTGSPGASFELFAPDGERLFSKTFVRPASDAVAVAFTVALPPGRLLKIGDRSGVRFPDLTQLSLRLHTNPQQEN